MEIVMDVMRVDGMKLKVMAHLMFGLLFVLVLTFDQMMRLSDELGNQRRKPPPAPRPPRTPPPDPGPFHPGKPAPGPDRLKFRVAPKQEEARA